MSQENVEAVRQARAAFNSGDPNLIAALLARDAEIVPMRAAFEGTSYRGPDAAQQFFADLNETWQEIKWRNLRLGTLAIVFSPPGLFADADSAAASKLWSK